MPSNAACGHLAAVHAAVLHAVRCAAVPAAVPAASRCHLAATACDARHRRPPRWCAISCGYRHRASRCRIHLLRNTGQARAILRGPGSSVEVLCCGCCCCCFCCCVCTCRLRACSPRQPTWQAPSLPRLRRRLHCDRCRVCWVCCCCCGSAAGAIGAAAASMAHCPLRICPYGAVRGLLAVARRR